MGSISSSTKHLLSTALCEGQHLHWDDSVKAAIHKAIGTIESGLWPPASPRPVLVIDDSELRLRCGDLLAAPGKYDRVLRESTTVLEDRIKAKVGYETLARVIPATRDLV